jgi:PPOX class probable F420-dependent enzyme
MSQKNTYPTRQYLTTPRKGHMTLLTSFRRNGTGVGTPVGTVASNGKLYFMTPADTWKAKRLATNPRVTLAPGNRKGEALGPTIEGTVRRLSAEEAKRAQTVACRHLGAFLRDHLRSQISWRKNSGI